LGLASILALLLVLPLLFARPAQALDIFTLWRQPMIPMHMPEGAWADYRTQVMAGGKRKEGITRIACLDRSAGTDDASWVLEVLPLKEEDDGSLVPVPGEGLRLRVSRQVLDRQGLFLDAVTDMTRWEQGVSRSITVEELKEDPLLSAALESDFQPDRTEIGNSTTRVVQGRQYLCDQFVFSAADTQQAKLPAGTMIQVSSREVTAAVNSQIPFLGLAYVTERVRSESTLDPPSRRFSPPPPRVRVEVMELVGFGTGARPVLGASD
jgi:hypothetical protein